MLYHNGVSAHRICAAASIDVKSSEQGLLTFAQLYNLPISFYTADELNSACGEFTASDFVNDVVGVDNVCERAAVLCGGSGRLIIKKTVREGVTVAAFELTVHR